MNIANRYGRQSYSHCIQMLAHILSLLRLAYISCVRPILEYDTTMFSPSTIYQPQPSQARNSKEGER